jgi:hypothetical protein
MSLRNKLPEIDAKLENHGSSTSAVAVNFHEDGATDLDQTKFRLDLGQKVSLSEMFLLSMGCENDGIIQVEARISQKSSTERGQELLDIKSLIRVYTKDGK